MTATRTRSVTAQEVQSALRKYQADPGPRALAELRELRWTLLDAAWQAPVESVARAWSERLRPAHELLKGSGLREAGRDAREEELFRAARAALAAGWSDPGAAGAAVAAMLLAQGHELALPDSLAAAPGWLRADFAAYLLEMPRLFWREGEAEAYADHLDRVLALFHREVKRRGDPAARELAQAFLVHANFIQAYFTDRNLRDLYRLRGDLIARALAWNGQHTLHALPPRRSDRGRIRLGVLSAHFGPQTETYFILANLDSLDRERFELILYTAAETGHALEEHAISLCDRFAVLSLDDLPTAVRTIRDDDLDLLLIGTNMSAVTNVATLLGAHRLARVQVASEVSPTTTGLHQVDVLMSAEWNQPAADAAGHYTEALYTIPGSINAYAFQYDTEGPPTVEATRAGLGIAPGQLVFFSGSNYFKILPELSGSWARILARVPGSALVLMPFNRNWSDRYLARPFLDRLKGQLAAQGVGEACLKVLDPVPTRADLQRILALADVYLDSFPFAGACSLVDALEAGVPPVLRRGASGRSNHGASIMRQMRMPETTAGSAEEYEEIAVRLAADAGWRRELAARLKAAHAGGERPYLDTRSLSQRVGRALEELYARFEAHYAQLSSLPFDELMQATARLLPQGREPEPGLAAFTDVAIVHHLVAPFFGSQADDGETRCMLDVGACFGEMALPFLARGWEVHLFEPDPECRRILSENVAEHAGARIVPAAVTNAGATVRFHLSRTRGLSGIAPSPYGQTEAVIEVPGVRLSDYCRERRIERLDFLKIDAEGHDFDVLASLDLARLKPRLILLEFGTVFAAQPLAEVNRVIAAMKQHGYRALAFCYDDEGSFRRGEWRYELRRIVLDAPLPEEAREVFGNLLFFGQEDKDFLLTLHALLDCARPRRAFLERDGGAAQD